jgi:putative GTP pyrophosphokinase
MAEDPERLNRFLEEYAQYARDVLQPTQLEIMELLGKWEIPDHWEKYKRTSKISTPTPIRGIFSRIKRPEQVVDKILRRPDDFPGGLILENIRRMHDTIGIRVLVYFLSHLPLVDREIRNLDQLEISEEEPPAAYMTADQAKLLGLTHLKQISKESGYSSVHYTLRLKNTHIPKPDRPWIEVQIRTLAQELWCVTEHHLGYKPVKRPHVAAKRQFKILSDMINAIDEQFNFLYEELNRVQEEVTYMDSDLLDTENIPPIMAEIGLSCAQRDINNIIKFLYSRGVETVHDIRSIATPRRLEIIHNTYLSTIGRKPLNLEVIATLAALKEASTEEEAVELIESQIAYRGAWDTIQQEFHQD